MRILNKIKYYIFNKKNKIIYKKTKKCQNFGVEVYNL